MTTAAIRNLCGRHHGRTRPGDTGAGRGGRDGPRTRGQAGRGKPAADVTPDREAKPDAPAAPPFYKRAKVMIPLGIAVAAAAVGGILYWLHARHYECTDDAFIDGRATQINPKVAGYVVALRVNDNQAVSRGDLLLEIDPRDYDAALAQTWAGLEAARDRVAQAESQITALDEASETAAGADVKAAEAVATNATQLLERLKAAKGGVAGQELDQARANERSAAAALTSARAKSAEAKARTAADRAALATARAGVGQSDAQVRAAELNLSYTKILAPVAGRVTKRTVETGDYLSARPGPVRPRPAGPVGDGQLQGNPAHAHADRAGRHRPRGRLPGRDLPAHVDSFQRGSGARFSLLPAENATGNYVKVVQRVPVKLVFDQPLPDDMTLGPGMSVVPRVKVR